MAQIQPVSIWKDGVEKQASEINLRIVADDMATSCTFFYELKEGEQEDADGNVVQGQVLTVGNVQMGGSDYSDWNGSNEDAYTFVADKLNIILV